MTLTPIKQLSRRIGALEGASVEPLDILGVTSTGEALMTATGPTAVKALLAITTADVSGLGSLATASSISLTTQATGTLQAGQAPAFTGDVTTTAGTLATTLATVNANVGTFGSATQSAAITLDAKGRATAASNVTIAPLFSSIASKPTTVSGYGITDAVTLAGALQTITGDKTFTGTVGFKDGTTTFQDNLDATKQMKFEVSGITTATTRTVTMPDANGTMVLYQGVFAAGGGVNALAFATQQTVTQTPAANRTYTTTVPPVGTECWLFLTTTGTTSFTLTFSTGFVTSLGTIATGVTAGKKFVCKFISDGVSMVEYSRVGPY